MKALITGGAGFIGSYLAEYLVGNGHRVVVVDDLSTGSMANIRHLLESPNFRFIRGSILDSDILEGAFSEHTIAAETVTIDTIFHLASVVGVQKVLSSPLEVLENAIVGIRMVMEAATRHGCRVLVASSSEVYGKNTSGNISEGDDRVLGSPLKSRWSYSEGKAIEELFAYTYWREHGTPVVIARLFNIVGPRQSSNYGMVLPRFVRQAVNGAGGGDVGGAGGGGEPHSEPLTIYGDGSQRRCFCYVGDVVPALVELVSAAGAGGAWGKAFNIGSREEITIEALARKVLALTGSSNTLQFIPYEEMPEGFEDMPRRVPDITNIQQVTSFNPRTSLDEVVMMLAEAERGGAGRPVAGQPDDDRYVRGGSGQTQSGRLVAGQPDDDRYVRGGGAGAGDGTGGERGGGS